VLDDHACTPTTRPLRRRYSALCPCLRQCSIRRLGVSQVVETQRLQAGRAARPLEPPTQRGGVEPASEPVREHVVVGRREHVSPTQAIKGGRRLVGHRHLARPPALGGRDLDVAGYSAADDELATREVDVTPTQRDELAAASTCSGE